MNLPLFIAFRYFFSKKKKNFINIIASISMVVVSVSTAALIIGLSVFNGMEDLLRSIYVTYDAPLQISLREGKSFVLTEELEKSIRSTDGVEDVIKVIEDNALLKYKNAQMIVRLKGVSDNFIAHKRMKSSMQNGYYRLFHDSLPQIILGRGVQYKMGILLKEYVPAQIFYPKNKVSSSLNASGHYSKKRIMPAGVFSLEQSYDDNHVFVPIEFADQLMNYKGKCTSLELVVDESEEIQSIQNNLKDVLGNDFEILTSDQQHADFYKVLKIEKLFVFLFLSLIVGIASMNIFFSLSMLVIEKKSDIKTYAAMGASRQLIRKIFLYEGGVISLVGVGSGLMIGLAVVWSQQTFGFATMGVRSAIMSAYPVKLLLSDFLYTALCILGITSMASILPARKAAKQLTEL